MLSRLQWLDLALRGALLGEFLGHGIYAIQREDSFLALLSGSTGISEELARPLLLFIGIIDVLIASVTLIRPWRPLLLYATLWGFLTALSRPLSGLSILDFIERWPNWATPLALLYVRAELRRTKALETTNKATHPEAQTVAS